MARGVGEVMREREHGHGIGGLGYTVQISGCPHFTDC